MKDLFITHVPQIKGLTVQEIIKEAKKNVEIQLYLPNLVKGRQPDRNFVGNIGKWLKRVYSKL